MSPKAKNARISLLLCHIHRRFCAVRYAWLYPTCLICKNLTVAERTIVLLANRRGYLISPASLLRRPQPKRNFNATKDGAFARVSR